MERWTGRTALVTGTEETWPFEDPKTFYFTGASRGIGLAIAETLVRCGINVIGCARNTRKIEELAQNVRSSGKHMGTICAIKCDLNNEEDILRMFSEIEDIHHGLDILVNNAGLAHPEPLMSGNTDRWREIINVNVIALSVCAREALRLMEKNNVTDGHIINVNSMAGHSLPPMADFHMYGGTKHMVTMLSKALFREIHAHHNNHIRVTNLSPGAVDTDFHNRVQAGKPANGHKVPEQWNFKFLSSQDLADAVVYILGTPQHVCIKELIMAPTKQPAAFFD